MTTDQQIRDLSHGFGEMRDRLASIDKGLELLKQAVESRNGQHDETSRLRDERVRALEARCDAQQVELTRQQAALLEITTRWRTGVAAVLLAAGFVAWLVSAATAWFKP